MSKAEDYTHIGATNDIKELGNGPWDKGYQPSGISKAEERAMQAYPNMTFPFTPLDLNAYRRGAFINGYEQAEKDLALTWGDVQLLDHFVLELVGEERKGKDWGDRKGFYAEVLTRFKKFKEESHD